MAKDDLYILVDSRGKTARNGKVLKPIGKEYDLSKLDVSKIKHMNGLFINMIY